ncbi:hypothetical protein QBC33DRAFT_621257 [Phialemonium atrogriseum]|uniref:Uncharacterized protein n=1 Tax=Phialemonium atrogriseum TaxID=1093897 RepID=A0AAJ0FKF1_9PEZI|nr:uncharacterized protein QBC33DRAFT_621257 [Phialemonium atrogriseum]KAK1765479.1 hypothetical protein QBC33DRAFT_621257 [Phialemonium atrogriseum]
MSSPMSLSSPTTSPADGARLTRDEDTTSMIDLVISKLDDNPDEVVLSGGEARRLVALLSRKNEIVRELSKVTEDLKEIRFLTRYGDYAKEMWTDMKSVERPECFKELPKLPQRPAATLQKLREEMRVAKGQPLAPHLRKDETKGRLSDAFAASTSFLQPHVAIETSLLATEAYADRNEACHAPIEDLKARKDSLGLADLIDRDMGDLVDCLPDSRSDELPHWKLILDYFRYRNLDPTSDTWILAKEDDVAPVQHPSDKETKDSSESTASTTNGSASPIGIEALGFMLTRTATFLFERNHFASWPEYPALTKSESPGRLRRSTSVPWPGGEFGRVPGRKEFFVAVDAVLDGLLKLEESCSSLPAAVRLVGEVDRAIQGVVSEALSEAKRRAEIDQHDV